MKRPCSAPTQCRYGAPDVPWEPGWSQPPSARTEPRWTIPSSHQGKGPNQGFRKTYLDKQMESVAFVPGPGAFKAALDFLPPSLSEKERTRRNRRPHSASHIQARRPSACGAAKSCPEPGHDMVDAKRLFLSRPAAPRVPRALRLASLSLAELTKAPHSAMPTSFHTPGPGAYTQYASFGLACPPKKPQNTRGMW